MEPSVETRLAVAQDKLDLAKVQLAELYARGAATVMQRRTVGELGAEVTRLQRELGAALPTRPAVVHTLPAAQPLRLAA
jgi:hypothetical protein